MEPDKPHCFVATIQLNQAEKLRSDLTEQGFDLTTPPNTVFSAKKKGISCTLYVSGKLTVQGKEKEEFISYYLEPEILKTFTYSYPTELAEIEPHIGVDESGKGDFFGPLCVAAVYADKEMISKLLTLRIKDSKTLSDRSCLLLSQEITKVCPTSLIVVYPKKYNELYAQFKNLNSLLAWGHGTAITELVEKTGCREVLIDQFASEHLVINALKKKKMEVNLKQRHRAESDLIVAAASIVARGAFLRGLKALSEKVNITLPKGASRAVILAGKQVVRDHGLEILGSVAKLHFKTYNEVVS